MSTKIIRKEGEQTALIEHLLSSTFLLGTLSGTLMPSLQVGALKGCPVELSLPDSKSRVLPRALSSRRRGRMWK